MEKGRVMKKSKLYISLKFFLTAALIYHSTIQTKEEEIKEETVQAINDKIQIKDWNFIVYLAANNNLHPFSIKNLQQMTHVGSTDNINIVAQLDGYRQTEISRYFIEKNNPILIKSFEHNYETISGTTASLYNFVEWAIKTYPARHQALVLWNHGSGIKDPHIWGKKIMMHRDRFFVFNYETGLLELNKNLLSDPEEDDLKNKGIAFNDTYETYITNQELQATLDKISQELLGGKKIDLLCMDACHMAMVEIGSQIKSAVNYMVASQEIEPGGGYNYIYLLEPFIKSSFTPIEFAQHVTHAYQLEYSNFNADFTQSAVNLNSLEKLEENIKQVSCMLVTLLEDQKIDQIARILRIIRMNWRYTTEFCDPDYIDFCHFYKSLSEKIRELSSHGLNNPEYTKRLNQLERFIDQGLNMIQNYIIKNASGINLPHAYGLSIYFPKRSIDSYYYKTEFDQKTNWTTFLVAYLKSAREKQTTFATLHLNKDCDYSDNPVFLDKNLMKVDN